MTMPIIWKSVAIPSLLFALLALPGCSDDDIQDLAKNYGGVTVSGTLNNLGPYSGGGIHLMGIFPAGVPAGPTGNVGGGPAPGGNTVAFTLNAVPNSGAAYIFAFQDKNASGDPTNPGTDEPYGCSTVFNIGSSPVTGIVVNIDYAIDPGCP